MATGLPCSYETDDKWSREVIQLSQQAEWAWDYLVRTRSSDSDEPHGGDELRSSSGGGAEPP